MASYDFDSKLGRYYIRFRFGGKPFKRSLSLADQREAEIVCGTIEEAIKDIKRGRLDLPPDAEVGAFLISGGKVLGKPVAANVSKPCQMRLAGLFDAYERELTAGSKEATTRDTERVHRGHLTRHFGGSRPLPEIDHRAVQGYINKRAAAQIAAKTIRMELSTLRLVWNWGRANAGVDAPLPWDGRRLTYPKNAPREPFQTREQIERKIQSLRAAKRWSQRKESRLWECLYLGELEVTEILDHVRTTALYPFVFPMIAFAAYTGARRSEIIRSEREDWDFDAGMVAIRQKKADTTQTYTVRQAPIHTALAKTMQLWFAIHPGGPQTICTDDRRPLGPRMATKYFRQALHGSRWAVVPGFHCFRHSLASNLASRGIDQRIIDEILGHSTEEMRRRYRHLLPKTKADSIQSLFH